ncbi:MAG TPA: histidinol dehydrogenase [Longimicrobiales bacterium]|nr:histidinol dehydrogenase [Longimicrobiales bacterium]
MSGTLLDRAKGPVGGAPAGPVRLAARGRLADLDADARAALLTRGRSDDADLRAAVEAIVSDVRGRGDAALRDLAARYDGVTLGSIEVPDRALRDALAALDSPVRAALERAAARIAAFHEAARPGPSVYQAGEGIRLERRFEALRRAGVYAPGGRASYPSSVLMCALPARAAGVEEVLLCSPPGADGLPPPLVLAAAAIAGVDRVFALGGAGAVAALAYGTETVPAVDCVVGPGNAWVAEAKRQVAGRVVTDAPAGPSEILILADATADPALLAAEMLAQAEHDPDASAVLVALDETTAAAVEAELARQLSEQARRDVAARALAAGGAILTASAPAEALAFAAAYAPEHLSLVLSDPARLLPRIRHAGTVFVGQPSSVVFGDYLTGANHTLPTGGLSRAWSGLSTETFLRAFTVQTLSEAGAASLAGAAALLAEREGLPAHAAAARLRASTEATVGSDPTVPAGSTPLPTPPPGRRAYRSLTAYDPDRPPVRLDLSDNTSRFGTAPSALRALADDGGVSRYPSAYADELRASIAAYHGVDAASVCTGCGSDDVIDSALRAFCEPGAVVAHPDPTFGMVGAFALMNGLRPAAVATAPGEPDVDRLLAPAPACVYLCRPDNPTGAYADAAFLRRLDGSAPGVVLLDEAYADFAGTDMTRWAAGSRRTIALRTFSKAWGLAGARIGYAVGPARLIAELRKSRGPYKVSAVAERAAVAALRQDDAWRRRAVGRAIAARVLLNEGLVALGLRPLPSRANFLLAPVSDAAAARDALLARGIGVRAFRDLREIGDAIRITVAPEPALNELLDAVEAGVAAGEIAAP